MAKCLPELDEWQRDLDAALGDFQAEVAEAEVATGDIPFMLLWNAQVRLWLAFAEALDKIGGSGVAIRDALRKIALTGWPERDDQREERAIAVALAYREGLRLSQSGAKDSRMEAAMQFVAAMEGNDSEGAAEGIRTSIKRLRKSLRDTNLFKLDRETLLLSVVEAEGTLLAGLPGRKGRPRKAPEQTEI